MTWSREAKGKMEQDIMDMGTKHMEQLIAIRRLGTLAIDIVEANPVVFGGRLWLMEYVRNRASGSDWETGRNSCFRFRSLENPSVFSEPFGHGLHMGNAFAAPDGRLIVTAVEGWGKSRFYQLESTDMVHWSSPRVILEDPAWEGYNTSVCQADGRFVIVFELGKPEEMVGVPFTMFFAESADLVTWRVIPGAVFGREIYTGAPMLRWHDGFFYFFHLEGSYEEGFVTQVARSRDLRDWERGLRPVLERHADDRQILPAAATWFSQEQLVKIASAVNINASDLDMCDYAGKLRMCYSWGNQRGTEFLALAEADCTEREFCESFFR